MQLNVAYRGKVNDHNLAMSLLQRQCGIHGCRGCACASFSAEEGEDTSFTGTAASAGAVGAESRERFKQGIGTGSVIEEFSSSGAHGSHYGGGLLHAPIGKNRQLQGIGLNQLNRFYGPLRILRGNIYEHDFRTLILNLAQDGIGRTGREAHCAENYARQPGGFQAALQFRQTIAIFGQQGYWDPRHVAVLVDSSRCLHVR
jgi:hypothetical protein